MIQRILKRRWLCLSLTAALSILAHIKGITAPLLDYHHHRQVNTAAIARNYWREHRPLLQPRVDWEGPEDHMAATELPVHMWLFGQLWPLFGLGEIWGRILSVLASALTAVVLLLLLEREIGLEAAFFGACLFTVIPLEIYFGRTVQPEAIALLGSVASLYFWDSALGPKRPWWAWCAAVLSVFISVGLKLPYAYILIALAGLTWRRLGMASLRDMRSWFAVILSMGGVFAWYRYASTGVYVVPTHSDELLAILGWERLPYFIQFLLASRFIELVTTYGGLPLFFYGAKTIFFQRRDVFWLAWFGGVLFHLIVLGNYAHSHEYSALPFVPVVAGVMGLGVWKLKQAAQSAPAQRRGWLLGGVALLVAVIPVNAAFRIRHWYNQSQRYLANAPTAAAAVSGPNDVFFTNSRAPSVALYYLNRRGWSAELEYKPEIAAALIDSAAKKGARFLSSEKTGLFAAPDGVLWKKMTARSAPLWDDGHLVIFRLPN